MVRKVHQLLTLQGLLLWALWHMNVLWDAHTFSRAVTGGGTGGCVGSPLSLRGSCQGAARVAPDSVPTRGVWVFQLLHTSHSCCHLVLLVDLYLKWMDMERTTLSSAQIYIFLTVPYTEHLHTDVFSICLLRSILAQPVCSFSVTPLFSGISVYILNVSLLLRMCVWAFSSFQFPVS